MAFQNLSIHARLPPRALFSWFFDDAPDTVPPRAPADSTWIQPFAISASIFHDLLDVKVPATIAAVYLVSAILLNHLNKGRQHRPWRFAKSSAFKGIVLFHNAFLALFSAWTFYGLYYSLKICWPWETEQNLLAQVADSLCRVTSQDGPHGSDLPEASRLWNEGYAYFSWLFYLSKFYEVVDTLIILAKGKESSMLQTYHHTGVMFCMWAAVRYMSPPAIVGILLNSAIHALMYSYFAWTSLGLPVSGYIKQSLTTLQITQFFVGCIIGCSYLFIEYDTLVHHPGDSSGQIPSTLTGHKGIANPVSTMPSAHLHNTRQHFQVRRAPCVKDNKEAFAVWLTTLYCLPLIYLFIRFFSRSYLKRAKSHTK